MSYLAPCFYILKHVAILLCLVLSSCGVGLGAASVLKLDKFSEHSTRLEKTFFLLCLGLSVWSYAIFCLGLAHLIYKSALAVLFVLSFLPYLRLAKTLPKSKLLVIRGQTWSFIALIAIITLPVFIKSLYCATGWDDTMYHLPIAKAFLDSHHLIATPFLRYVVFNNFTNLLFVPLLAVGGDTASNQLSVASFIFCGLGIYACLKRFNSANAGLIGLLAWSSSSFLWDLGSTSLVDMNLALMALGGTYAALNALESKEATTQNRFSILAGAFLGCTVASKLLGALLVTSLLAAANAVSLFSNQINLQKLKPVFLITLKIGILAGIVAAPWFLRSYFLTGNPVWPFAEKIFGLGNLWSIYDYSSQADSLAATKGLTRSVWNFLILPFLISFKTTGYEQLVFMPFLAFGVYMGAPLLFVKGSRSTKILFSTVLCFLLLWFVSTQQVRYLMAAAPVMCLLAAAVLDRYLNAFTKSGKLRSTFVAGLSGLVLLFGFEHIAYAEMFDNWQRLPFDNAHRIAYLNSRLPLFTTVSTFSVLPPGKIYGLEMENMQYFANGRMIGDWFGPARYEDFRLSRTSGESMYQHLNRLGVTYLAVDLKNTIHFELPTDASFNRHFQNIFTDGTGAIYKLRYQP